MIEYFFGLVLHQGKKYSYKTSSNMDSRERLKKKIHAARLSLPTFSLMLITPLNFKCRTSTGYF